MLAQKAKQMGMHVIILDPTPCSPAGQVADEQILGGFDDHEKLRALVERCEVTTYDLEHIDTAALKFFDEAGHRLFPSPHLLEIIQDKLAQKEVLAKHGIPLPAYQQVDRPSLESFSRFGFPLVQKARFGGYDGRGVIVMRNAADFTQALPVASTIERALALEKELAVMVARDHHGNLACYPVVEMVFDPRGNVLDLLLAPARIAPRLAQQARKLALAAVQALAGVGVFGVELFLSKEEKLFVNEVAPRPHNSGHYTIEACVTSQYEQHLRAILGMPLGDTSLLRPAAMLNLLGEPSFVGKPLVRGLQEALAIPGLSFHLYGKAETRPLRKMGHVTIMGESMDEVLIKAQKAKALLRIEAEVKT
ncbi:MAG: 5-(carboxyamino)imidazole ribonucleotide synthase [candidate division KSB1 bacterium]